MTLENNTDPSVDELIHSHHLSIVTLYHIVRGKLKLIRSLLGITELNSIAKGATLYGKD